MASSFARPDMTRSSTSITPPKVVQDVTLAMSPRIQTFRATSFVHQSTHKLAPSYADLSSPSSHIRRKVVDEVTYAPVYPASPSKQNRFYPSPDFVVSRTNNQRNRNSSCVTPGAVVERIINCAEAREAADRESSRAFGENSNAKCLETLHGGPFTFKELSQLSLLCATGTSASGGKFSLDIWGSDNNGWKKSPQCGKYINYTSPEWASIDGDILASLVPKLQAHVVSAAGVDLVGEGRHVIEKWLTESQPENDGHHSININQWMLQTPKYPANASSGDSSGERKITLGFGFVRLQILLRGLEAAHVLLAIMTSPGIDRRAVDDDAIEACVNLIKNHIQKHIIPSLSNNGHLGASGSSSRNEADNYNGVDGGLSIESTPKKSRKSGSKSPSTPNRDVVSRGLRKVYFSILSTIGLFATVMERFEAFIVSLEMDDGLLFTLSAAALSTLSIDTSLAVRADAMSLTSIAQVSSMNLVAAIFRRYPRHRSIVIEDLFPLMLKLPTSRRSLRTFLIKMGTVSGTNKLVKSSVQTPSVQTPSGRTPIHFSSNRDFIQPISALTLLLIQSCVTMPFQSDDDVLQEGDPDAQSDEDNDEEKLRSKANDTSGLDGCVTVCHQFTSQMLLRCSRKGEEGGASEFRPVLSNLVDDLLLVRQLPEYPAAEMLLFYLCRKLSHDLIQASSSSKSSGAQAEATYLSTATDTLGRITSSVASSLLQNKEDSFKLPNEKHSERSNHREPTEEVNRCFCGRGNLDTFMVDCDRCHSWFHGSCVGITKDTVPETWLCDDCALQTAVLDQAQVFARKGGLSNDVGCELSDNNLKHVLRQLLLSYLSNLAQSSTSPLVDRAREFLIATWVKDITMNKGGMDRAMEFDLSLLRSHVISQWSFPKLQRKHYSRSYLSIDGNSRIMAFLVASSELSLAFPRLLAVLLQLMGDDMASLRKLSVKAVLQVVNVDPSLMIQPSVRKAVSRCFHDESISVREAAVSLLGDYILQSPILANAFHSALLERIVDRGVSVRKRVVKIFRDILLSNPCYDGRSAACHAMLQRAADRKEDDGVRDLIHETFHTLWFSSKTFQLNSSDLQPNPENSSANSVTNLIRHRQPDKGLKSELYCREAAKQMVEVVKVSGSPYVLTSLMKGLLFGITEGDKDKKVAERKRRQEDSRRQCGSLVSSLIELLLAFEENRPPIDEGGELVAIMSTISVFSYSYPELLVPQIDTLAPYLKGDNAAKQHETAIVSTVSGILSRVVPHLSSSELGRLSAGDLPGDLVNIAYKFPADAVSSAVEALCQLSNHPDISSESIQEQKLLKLAIQFYSYLLKTKDVTNNLMTLKKSARDNVRRALSALGSICRYFECDDIDQIDLDPSEFAIVKVMGELRFSENILSNACFAIFLEYLKKEDAMTKCLALRAMTGVFISRPRVILTAEQLGIISFVMSEQSHPIVQLESLRCWRDILLAEEKRIESGEARAKMAAQKDITVSKQISGDQDGDACISGSVLTAHAARLYEMTRSPDEKIRLMIVDLIGHLLRQGLINPMETVPYLLALQGDIKSPATRSLALKLLIIEGEKRPDMLRQRICAGIKESFNFQRQVYPLDRNDDSKATALLRNVAEGTKVEIETIFDCVFKESSIRNKKLQRQGLYKSIISLFEREVSQGVTVPNEHIPIELVSDAVQSDVDRLPLLAFASQILAHLPYNCASDPLFIVYHSSCLTTLDGAEILVQFAKLLGNDLCDPNPEEDDLERAAKIDDPIGSDFAVRLRHRNFDAETFGELCVEATILTLLLRLKNFLRKAYNLSDARITEYLPSEKERIHEKGISILEGTPKFDCDIEPIFEVHSNDNEKKKVNWNAAIRTYATFRILMREGEADNNTLHVDESIMRRRGPGRKRKRDEDPLEYSSLSQVPPD